MDEIYILCTRRSEDLSQPPTFLVKNYTDDFTGFCTFNSLSGYPSQLAVTERVGNLKYILIKDRQLRISFSSASVVLWMYTNSKNVPKNGIRRLSK